MNDVIARLAGITCLSLAGRGPTQAFLFEPHRLALPSWALATNGAPALLVTLDRHFDLVAPIDAPTPGASVLELDAHARLRLDPRNVDHILAAMEAGIVTDAIVIARSSPVGSIETDEYVDRRGGVHHLLRVPTVRVLAEDYGRASASPQSLQAHEWLSRASHTLLDFDLDCFTSPSDVEPLTVLPWPRDVIEGFLHVSAEPFWNDVLARCVGLTFALEPLHCGGVVAGHRLFADAADVIFRKLLHADVP